MKRAFKLFGITTRLVFEVFFTYLMIAMIGMGFDKILYVGVVAGVIGIALGMADFLMSITEPKEEEESIKPKLYYKIKTLKAYTTDAKDEYFFEVYSHNHELICESDVFKTHDGAITGLWYLMNAMGTMNELNWKCHSN